MESKRKPDLPPAMGFAMAFGTASATWQTVLTRRLAPHGLTPAQLSVLAYLSRRPQARVTEIARTMDIGQPGVTKMLAKFEGQGWITLESDSGDRRVRTARISDTGRAHLAEVQRAALPEMKGFVEAVDPDDLARMTEMLRAFTQMLDATRQLDDKG